MKPLLTTILASLFLILQAQEDLNYYIPDIDYDPDITTPEEFLGWQVGDWHVSHDKLYYYMKHLAEQSERITMTEYARSHEERPLIYLTITSPDNHQRLDEIKAGHQQLTQVENANDVDIENMPLVIYQGCSIHGNEPSGSNGALAIVYYLAAGQDASVDQLLNDVVILFDPSYNPDGLNRFASWVNSHKGESLISDPRSREFNEAWPRGRTNHYWFDLNRDWLLLTHPESQGRIRTFQEWKPDILTDHHEMGTNSTFFFQPGIPSRTNPNTPDKNQELTYEIGKFHGRALDEIGSLYYTKESFDDYYYGKGSTYPDAQGCIGILFEQASSRGHLQESSNGMLTFPFTIRNQVKTMLSTQAAAVALRKDILEYKRQSFLETKALANANPSKAYVFNDTNDPYKVARFIDILLQHKIKVYKSGENHSKGGHTFAANTSYVVPLAQDQYRLAKSIFEQVDQFQDSLFYDVSAWTMPLAFDIPYAPLERVSKNLLGAQLEAAPWPEGGVMGDKDSYAYLIEWNHYMAPQALNELVDKDVMVKVANEAFTIETSDRRKNFKRGTLIIPSGNNQSLNSEMLYALLRELAIKNKLKIYGVSSGLVESGVNLGSRSLGHVKDPRALILIGNGVNGYDAGEIWHHLDQIIEMPVPMVDIAQFSRLDLSKYSTIIMPDGSYSSMGKQGQKLKEWVQAGGNIIAFKGALNYLKGNKIIALTPQADTSKKKDSEFPMLDYAGENEERGAKFTGGMIAMADIDPTHPLFYGYERNQLPIFKRGNDFYKPTDNYDFPARYSQDPHLSGYLHADNAQLMPGSAAVFTKKIGRGKVIGIVDNPLFRGYWWGGSKLFANALFFSSTF